MTPLLLAQVAPKEPMLTAGVRWLGPFVIALGCGGFLLILAVVLLVAVFVGARRKE